MIDNLEPTFDALWIEHHEYLTDHEQLVLLRCLHDEPDRVLGLFQYFIERSLGRVVVAAHYETPAPTKRRRCLGCKATLTTAAQYCKSCTHERYLIRKAKLAATNQARPTIAA